MRYMSQYPISTAVLGGVAMPCDPVLVPDYIIWSEGEISVLIFDL